MAKDESAWQRLDRGIDDAMGRQAVAIAVIRSTFLHVGDVIGRNSADALRKRRKGECAGTLLYFARCVGPIR